MAAIKQSSLGRSDSKITLEIRTKSIEQTLIPLVTQVSKPKLLFLVAKMCMIIRNANINEAMQGG